MPIPSASILQTPVHSASPSEAPSSVPKSEQTEQLVAQSVNVKNEQAAVKRTTDELVELDRYLREQQAKLLTRLTDAERTKIEANIDQVQKMLKEG